ncbi:hypothetical protein [Symbiopectobacterium purcellii]|uniref:hypothetical protein n=1 Tax=Symbiopectobacterium purcellii TaxID=2871826 RepID=UPI003F8305B9
MAINAPGDIANRLKNDYILCPDMRQRSIAGCYQNNVAWLYMTSFFDDRFQRSAAYYDVNKGAFPSFT